MTQDSGSFIQEERQRFIFVLALVDRVTQQHHIFIRVKC